jgi:hypothetical protein
MQMYDLNTLLRRMFRVLKVPATLHLCTLERKTNSQYSFYYTKKELSIFSTLIQNSLVFTVEYNYYK